MSKEEEEVETFTQISLVAKDESSYGHIIEVNPLFTRTRARGMSFSFFFSSQSLELETRVHQQSVVLLEE